MAASPAKRAGISPMLCMALSALLVPRSALPALPPASVGSSTQIEPSIAAPRPAAGKPAGAVEEEGETSWWQKVGLLSPRYALYGSLGYEWIHNSDDQSDMTTQGTTGTVGARFNSYVWQPWFGRFIGDMRLHVGHNSFEGGGDLPGSSRASRNFLFSGNGRLSLMYRSRFPFETFYDRTYSRTTAEFSPLAGSTLNERYGFTQAYTHESGANASLDWNRSTQSANNDFGGSRLDSLQLTMNHRLPEHTLGAIIGRTNVKQDGIDSLSRQDNAAISHNYAPEDEYYTVDSTANINTSTFRLERARSDVRLSQISSVASYRPEEDPYTITASVRALGLTSELTDPAVSLTSDNRKLQTTNLSLGMTYTLSQETYAFGTVNLNNSDANGEKRTNTSEAVSITHSPAGIELGDYFYRWSTSAGASHSAETHGEKSGELSLQLSHSLTRNIELDGGSRINLNATQAISAAVQSRRRNFQENPDLTTLMTPSASKRLTHNATASWNTSEGTVNGMVHVGYSDSRALDGPNETFQMLNVQFSGGLQTGGDSHWSGSLGVQAIKQDVGQAQLRVHTVNQEQGDVQVSSNGSVSYRHGRLFGVRRMTFSSSVRLSSSALLPILGGASDYETAAWDTSLDYSIGRLILRASALISRNVTPVIRRTTDGFELSEGEAKLNKSIMFTVTRTFGY